MTKVQIMTTCEQCNGEAYVPSGEAEDNSGRKYIRFNPCPSCEGTGLYPKWVSLQEFAVLLHQAQCAHEQTSFQGGFHFSAGDVWDDLTEVCNECNANLDKLTRETSG